MSIDTEKNTGARFALKWTLARKIGGLAAFLLAVLIAVALYNYLAIGSIGAEMAEVADVDLPVTRLITQIDSDQLEKHLALEKMLRLGGVGIDLARTERDAVRVEYRQLSTQFDEDMLKATQAIEQAAK